MVNSQRAFAKIILLVVLAVVASLLLPALSSARASSTQEHRAHASDATEVEIKAVSSSRQLDIHSRKPNKTLTVLLSDAVSVAKLTDDPNFKTFSIRYPAGSQILTLLFSRSSALNKFTLSNVKSVPLRRYFFDAGAGADAGNFEDQPAPVLKPSCDAPNTAGISSIGAALNAAPQFPELSGCSDSEAEKTRAIFSELLHPDRVKGARPFQCQSLYDADSTLPMITWLTASTKMKFTCSKEAKSNFLPGETPTITVGTEALSADSVKAKKVVYHELLHAYGKFSESEVQAIVGCCSDESSPEMGSCANAQVFGAATEYDEKIPFMGDFLRDIALAKEIDGQNKIKIKAEIEDGRKSLKCAADHPDRAKVISFASQLDQICTTNTKLKACASAGSQFLKLNDDVICRFAKYTGGRVNYAGERVGAAPAAPDASTGQPAPVPAKLTYAPAETRVSDSAEIKKYDRSMSALSRGAQSVGNAFIASAGIPSASAATTSTLPRKNSDGSSSTELIGMKNGKSLLDIGNGLAMTATLSDPFSGEKESSSVQFYDAKTGTPISAARVEGLTGSNDKTAALTDAPSRARLNTISKNSKGSEAGLGSSAGVLGGVVSNGTGASLTSGGGGGGKSPSLGSDSSSSVRLPSPSSSSSTEPQLSASNLQRMISKSENPADAINAHIEDLRANSMMVRYMCKWFPADFKGSPKIRFSLDTLQGRQCSTAGGQQ